MDLQGKCTSVSRAKARLTIILPRGSTRSRATLLAKRTITQRRQERTHRVVDGCFRLALNHRRRADRARARRRWRALRSSRTNDFGAPRARARRAIPLRLVALRAVQNDRLRLRNRGLENIVTEIGDGRHLGLQNIVAQIGHFRARRHRALQNIATQIRFAARGMHFASTARAFRLAATTLGFKSLPVHGTPKDNTEHNTD